MFTRLLVRRRASTEGEKPFWISYADLMTAMMTLFLVAMAVTIVAITREVERELSKDEIRAQAIRNICEDVTKRLAGSPNIRVDCVDNRISFGEVGHFGYNDYRLPPGADQAMADLVPVVLDIASSPLGQKWFKQVVIEGHTDSVGPYLFNLHLSLQRSEWVMCLLADPAMNSVLRLLPEQAQQVRELFLAGGVSFNDPMDSDEASRRVELRMQFYAQDEDEAARMRPVIRSAEEDRCRLGT